MNPQPSAGPTVAVVGLGAVGAMTAWRLAARGCRVTGFEQFGIAHDRGASGGQTRRFSVQTQREHRLTPFALDALELWRELEEASGSRLLTQCGGVILGPEGTPSLDSAIASAVAHDLPHEVLAGDELRSRFPGHLVREGDVGVTDPMAGFVRPESAVARAAAVARDLGAELRPHTRVVELEAGPSSVRLVTATGTQTATHTFDQVVLTTGPWARELMPAFQERVVPRRLVQAWYLARDPERFHPTSSGVFERVGDVSAYGFPVLDGATVKIGVYTTKHPVVYDLGNPRRSVSEEMSRRLAGIVGEYFPMVLPDPTALATGMEGYSPDGLPLLGRLASHPRVVSAVGFSGSGFKFAPAMGDAVAAVVSEQEPRRDLSFLDPDRPLEPWPDDLLSLE